MSVTTTCYYLYADCHLYSWDMCAYKRTHRRSQMHVHATYIGLAITIYITMFVFKRCTYSIFGRECTNYTFTYGGHTQF
jgi:hypothetical protein